MRDTGWIIIGLVIFVILVTYPIWYNAASGKAEYVPDLVYPAEATECVKSTEYMRASHMDLLDEWRDEVVREGDRIFVAANGVAYDKSLVNTCMDCHTSKEDFCDRCHNYMAVGTPLCWECHVAPEVGGER